jgi:hypothetical protein
MKGEMQVLPNLRSHKEYINFVKQNLDKNKIPKAHEEVFDKLKLLDLTPIRLIALDLYSPESGRPASAPEDMMRTYVAMTLCGITSPTKWVNKYLKDESGFYAIISGFMPDNMPSVGCMYEFTNRLLSITKYCKQDHIRHKRKRLTKTQKNS